MVMEKMMKCKKKLNSQLVWNSRKMNAILLLRMHTNNNIHIEYIQPPWKYNILVRKLMFQLNFERQIQMVKVRIQNFGANISCPKLSRLVDFMHTNYLKKYSMMNFWRWYVQVTNMMFSWLEKIQIFKSTKWKYSLEF